MPVQALIQTGERTLLEYLWQPVEDAMSRALIEKCATGLPSD
jgi:hypothetical protein